MAGKGNFAEGFSLGDWNKEKRKRDGFERRREATQNAAASKAAEHLKTLISGSMVSISCDDKDLVWAMKGLVRGDSRFEWHYDNSNRIHFSAKKKTPGAGLKKA
jgi:hypothetical protein